MAYAAPATRTWSVPRPLSLWTPRLLRNNHSYIGRLATVAGIVQLRAVRDDGQRIHLRLQADIVAGPGYAFDKNIGRHLVFVHRNIAEKVDIRNDILSPESVIGQRG